MAIKKSQLYSALWESCNALRGSMDASQYKDYVLIILFVKYLSDKAGQPGFRLKVPGGCSFKDFVALKQDDNIGEKMNTKLEAIKELNARQIGDLTLPNFNDPTKLGAVGEQWLIHFQSSLVCLRTMLLTSPITVLPMTIYWAMPTNI